MKIVVWLLLVCAFPCCFSQEVLMDVFNETDSWTQILQKSKKEGKYILVDCIATWCGPCKKMEAITYKDKSLASEMMAGFVSVKIQMDSAAADSKRVRSWYGTANEFNEKYNVRFLPTFLFFSPEGKLVHRASGYKDVENMKKLLRDAVDPEQQYYTRLEKYNAGKEEYMNVRSLIEAAKKIGDGKTERKMAKDYINNYLSKQPDSVLLTRENMAFIGDYVQASDKIVFGFVKKKKADINKVMGFEKYAWYVMNRVIGDQYIKPALYTGKDFNSFSHKMPDWRILERKISDEYGPDYAAWSIVFGKIEWYKGHSDWNNLGRAYDEYFSGFGVDTSTAGTRMGINSTCWDDIFLKVTDTAILNKASGWMSLVVAADPKVAPFVDTYANLLYKAGRVDEALDAQKKAVELAPRNKGIAQTYEKMKLGEPTWKNN